jgi:hypothetical protein
MPSIRRSCQTESRDGAKNAKAVGVHAFLRVLVTNERGLNGCAGFDGLEALRALVALDRYDRLSPSSH